MTEPDILCIGSVLWDLVGRADLKMPLGADRPGKIRQTPGGVAMNIAMTLRAQGRRPALLSVVGDDSAGAALLDEIARLGLDARYLLRSPDLPTDRYMAIECPDGLVAAIADARSLEAAGDAILAPLTDGRLASPERPWTGPIALDGNLPEPLLARMAHSDMLRHADLRVAPASPGKAERLLALRPHTHATYYLNLEEAGLMAGHAFDSAPEAAETLVARGLARVIVTNGGDDSADAGPDGVLTATPPKVTVRRVTGAGDSFMAAHIAAEIDGATPEAALDRALQVAAAHVSEGHPLP